MKLYTYSSGWKWIPSFDPGVMVRSIVWVRWDFMWVRRSSRKAPLD